MKALRKLGDYELLHKIAAGGMGTVYVAVKRGPDGFSKQVAIKRIHPHLDQSEEQRQRFASEARIGARLAHPNIVAVFGYERAAEESYIVMEYVDGCSLAGLLRDGGLSPTDAALIVREVLSGLHSAHAHRDASGQPKPVLHRDINPKNILLSRMGEVKLADFGLARVHGESSFSVVGSLRGTFAYMSPEQASGKPLDPRSDLFSVGLVLYEALTGRRAYEGDTDLDVLTQAQVGFAIEMPLHDLDATVRRIIRTALAPTTEDRYSDAMSFATDLDRFLDRVGRPTRDHLARQVQLVVGPDDPPLPGENHAQPVTRVTAATTPLAASGLHKPRSLNAGTLPSGDTRKLRTRQPIIVAMLVLVALSATILVLVFAFEDRRSTEIADSKVSSDSEQPDTATDTIPHDAPLPDVAPRPKDASVVDKRTQKETGRPYRRKRRGKLWLNTLPVWSRVWIDGRLRGTTPLRVTLKVGHRRVRLRANGVGKPIDIVVRIREGKLLKKMVYVSQKTK